MNQLKTDYKFLHEKGITKPSQFGIKNGVEYDVEIIDTVTRYKHLLLNKLFLEKNGKSFKEIDKKMLTGVNNGKKETKERFNLNGIKGDIISYPLNQIFKYINDNFEELKGDNKKQIDVAEKFDIKNLGTFSRIIKGLGLTEKLGWIGINLPVEKFKKVILEIEKLEKNGTSINGENIMQIGYEIGINNPENLFTGITALGVSEKYSIIKPRITTNEKMKIIQEYIMQKYGKSANSSPFNKEEILFLMKHFENILSKNFKERQKSITSFLRFFGYTVLDIRDFSSLKKPVTKVENTNFY